MLMSALCAATLAPERAAPPAAVDAATAIPLDAPLPLRLGDDRASRDAGRNDLTLEQERTAARARQVAEQERMRQQAAGKVAANTDMLLVAARPAGGTPEENRELGRYMTQEFGWSEEQFGCLDNIWSQESNWTTTAENPSSGAYGIPQSLPGSKMATVAPDWRTNPATQIEWGLGYIDDVYGTPCSAWDFKQGTGWY